MTKPIQTVRVKMYFSLVEFTLSCIRVIDLFGSCCENK